MAAFLFDSLADEYYDPELHPTCANFRSGSLILVERFLRSVGPMGGIWCDLGAGNSVLLEVIERTLLTDEPFVIAVDGSAQMLDQTPSKRWHDAAPVVALVEHLPLDSSSVSLAIASLGDPYNTPAFWKELARVTMVGAVVCFTTPTYEWAKRYRACVEMSPPEKARFKLVDGSIVDVDSIVLDLDMQIGVAKRHGFNLQRVDYASTADLTGPISPKLRGIEKVVTAFEFKRTPG